MGMRLFVGNLPFSATEDEIKAVFEKQGTVKDCHIVMDFTTNRSKGFCFVEMSTQEEANSAVEQLNGVDFNGRPLNVSEARPKAERPQSNYGGVGQGGNNGSKNRW